ncbi:precorrin-6A reductase [Caloramator sp. ALD01]|uniref:precorrin-6A reductase n=1 Tax=Caloramator sp. ALD01 TaxID=1031288 RepID=UPI0004057B22|nr:precorrin-6A reductase [Caloramator sp. ALD01]
MIWVIGGTYETRILLDKLKEDYILTVATIDGKREYEEYNPIVLKLDFNDMLKFIDKYNIHTVVDISHPYAVNVSKNAREACKLKNVLYLRYERERVDLTDCIVFKDYSECNDYIKTKKGNFLFTIGSRNIHIFEGERGDRRYIYRILPSVESINECLNNNIDIDRIIALKGPFSVEFNMAILKEYKIDYIVMKNSGVFGGTVEKIKAAKNLGVVPLVIDREENKGLNIDEILNILNSGAIL